MDMHIKYKMLFTALALICFTLLSGLSAQPPDNIGNEYVVMFMENDIYGSDFPLELYITTPGKKDVHVTVTSPKWSKPQIDETFTVTPGKVEKLNISQVFRMIGSEKSSKALLIKADDDIVVYGGNKESYSNDVFVGLPTDVLGTEYYSVCYSPAFRKTELGVAVISDGTTLKITLPTSDPNLNVTYNNVDYFAGDTITAMLDKYDTIQLQSKSDKPVSAYSGNIKTNIGAVGQASDATQFVLSQQNLSEPADPSMMIIPPYELFGSDYTFATPEYSHPEYYDYQNEFMMVVKDKEKDGLLLDEKPLTSVNWNKISGYVTVSKGSHNVRHVNPTVIFAGYLYGHAYHESYAFPTGMRLAKINKPCVKTTQVDGDGLDNDCDGKIDEEDCTAQNQSKVNGDWSVWSTWSSCSVSCDKGHQIRNRSCDHPAPRYNGKNCIGNSTETKDCDTLKNCPVDPVALCKNKKSQIFINPVNCAQYYDCSKVNTSLGKAFLSECKYPKLFSSTTKKCEDFTSVKCDRRPEPQAPCKYTSFSCEYKNPYLFLSTTKQCEDFASVKHARSPRPQVNMSKTIVQSVTRAVLPCPKRLPSCVGLPDGNQTFPGKKGSSRTILNVSETEH
ncbi:hypothetical protein KUTeg_006031 [Tegillarca granosa]|uniref:Chitin-binding type-2 domain-containing protein n=1 Tax=Tegillarca granosa TaxID=220873 RepID=A0ABQ9FJB1_TEGGR|nr:hypothetical protein KUTeg_006031 [Tegillarca granosa]